MRIEDIDRNFLVSAELSCDDISIYNVCETPFKIYGLIKPDEENDRFRRMPEAVAKSVNDGVFRLHANTAGGRVRFRTNADYIAINAKMPSDKIGRMGHFPLAGSAGFDLGFICMAELIGDKLKQIL